MKEIRNPKPPTRLQADAEEIGPIQGAQTNKIADEQQPQPMRRRFRKKPTAFGSSRLFELLFSRRLKTAESETLQVGPVQGVPILGLDALGSSSYGPEAALAILIPVGAAGLWYLREVSR